MANGKMFHYHENDVYAYERSQQSGAQGRERRGDIEENTKTGLHGNIAALPGGHSFQVESFVLVKVDESFVLFLLLLLLLHTSSFCFVVPFFFFDRKDSRSVNRLRPPEVAGWWWWWWRTNHRIAGALPSSGRPKMAHSLGLSHPLLPAFQGQTDRVRRCDCYFNSIARSDDEREVRQQ